MTAFDLDPTLRWLFCLTHPDDEISICVWIRRLVENGNAVHLSWTHSNCVREREAREAALLLGVPQENLRFFGATDGAVCDELGALRPGFKAMMEEVRPDRVACGAFEQGHLDHDATNWLVRHTFPGPMLEIPFYHTYLTRLQVLNRFSNPAEEEVRLLSSEERQLKLCIARHYRSQNIWRVLLGYEAWQFVRLRRIELAKSERMRIQGEIDYTVPNHAPRLARRIEVSPSWQRWLTAVRAVR